MNKQAYLEEAYDSAFNNELEKISFFSSKDKKKAESEHWKRVGGIIKNYQKEVAPYKNQETAYEISKATGAAGGGVLGATLLKNKVLGALLGIAAGGYGASGLAKRIIGAKHPKWREAHEIADVKYQRGWDASARQLSKEIRMGKLKRKSESIKKKMETLSKK